MAITTTPGASPLSAYLPNVFVGSVASANPVKWAYVEVFINAISTATIPVPLLSESPAGPYNFEVDVQAVLQDSLAPTPSDKSEVFGTLNTSTITLCADAHLEYSVELTYKYIDPTTGLLTDLGVTDTSGLYYAIDATRQRKEAQDFLLYIPDSTTPDTQKWLTNSPLTQTICPDENAFLCHIAISAATQMRVRTFNDGGGLIDEGFITINTSIVYEVQTLGVGIPQLSGIAWRDQGGAPTTVSFTGIYSYTIELSDTVFPYPDYIQTRTFIVESCCSNSVRLHWLNLLGGADSYTFKSLQKKSNIISYETGQKALNKTFTYSDRGAFKYFTDASTLYEASSPPLEPTVADWLKEVALSNEVYLETADGLLPIVVRVEEVQTEKRVTGELNLVVIKITFTEANDLIIQHA